MAPKYYGSRPQSFTIDDSGMRYYIGAEVIPFLLLNDLQKFRKK